MTTHLRPFLDIFEDASRGNSKVPQSEYLPKGEIPVVDQGQQLIGGYVNDEAQMCKAIPPVIIFGDHTRAIKYVDFRFAIGADGTKVLKPKVEADTKYLYYALIALRIPAAGYSRHYKFLKEAELPFPPLPEQKRIATILDAADALRAKRRESIKQLDALIQSTFIEMFGDPVTNPMAWETRKLGTLLTFKNGVNFSAAQRGSGIATIDVKNMYSGSLTVDNSNLYRVDVSPREDQVLRSGDILFVRSSVKREGVGWACLFKPTDEPITYCGFLIRGRPISEGMLSGFCVACVRQPGLRAQLVANAGQVAITNISQDGLARLTVPLPPVERQQKYLRLVSSVQAQKDVYVQHLLQLDELFASLQSLAFVGEL